MLTGPLFRVNGKPLLDWPLTVTTTFPVSAPAGTVAMIVVVEDQLVVDAVTALNVTDPEVPNLVPTIVTDCPMPRGFGEIEEIVGADASAKQQARTTKAALRPNLRINCSTPRTSTMEADAHTIC